MDHRRALLVDAFTTEPYAGNPAGVVPEAGGLGEEQMQSIAAELGASETAFLLESGHADRRLRYFTPTTEVDLCGHATIASLAYLSQIDEFDEGTHEIETNVGTLSTEIAADGRVWMSLSEPSIRRATVSTDDVASALGIETRAIGDVETDVPIARASTGFPFLIVPVAYLEDLGGADPDFEALQSLADADEADGIYAFTFDTLDGASTGHGRAFVPGAGIPEDPVTGTASGAVGAYLRHFGAFDEVPEEMRFEQGHYVDRPGRVDVRARDEIQVGGRAAVTLDGRIAEPDADEDDIIEV
jgi:PhzF family phenazine biosynthesis protein